MALEVVDLQAQGSPEYSNGAKDTGEGVGLESPTPLLPTWRQYAYPPDGWRGTSDSYSYLVGCWVDQAGYFYGCYHGAGGYGTGIYRYALDSNDPRGMTYGNFVSLASILSANYFTMYNSCAIYDAATDKVILVGFQTSGTGNTPIVGQWDCSTAWPFTAANADWLSPVQQSYGSYVAGRVTNHPIPFVSTSRVYLASSAGGHVITLDRADGSIDGTWVYSGSYHAQRLGWMLGESGSKPFFGAYNSTKNLSLWDATNLSAWSEDTVIYKDSQAISYGFALPHRRAPRSLYYDYYHARGIHRPWLDLLGFSSTSLAWLSSTHYDLLSGYQLLTYDPATSEYSERILPASSYNRFVGNGGIRRPSSFVKIGGAPWFVSWAEHSQDHEEESPGTGSQYQIGLVASPVGPGRVRYTLPDKTASLICLLFKIGGGTTKNFARSEDWSKFRARYQKNGGAWSDWRSGPREMWNLGQEINGKAAWPSYTPSDTMKVEIDLCSGWPYDWGGVIRGNPGKVGDPDTPQVCTSNPGAPRDVEPILFIDSTLPDDGKVWGKPGAGVALNMRPGAGVASVGS